jgi:hypothetical protein
MFANLDRDEFIRLLERLGSESDAEALGAARDLHAKITVAEVDWDDLLVPEGGIMSAEDGEVEDDNIYDDDLTDVSAVAEETAAPAGDGGKAISEEEKTEARDLIAKIEALEISEDTKAELADYKNDLESGDFLAMDLRYLRAFHKRLAK